MNTMRFSILQIKTVGTEDEQSSYRQNNYCSQADLAKVCKQRLRDRTDVKSRDSILLRGSLEVVFFVS